MSFPTLHKTSNDLQLFLYMHLDSQMIIQDIVLSPSALCRDTHANFFLRVAYVITLWLYPPS